MIRTIEQHNSRLSRQWKKNEQANAINENLLTNLHLIFFWNCIFFQFNHSHFEIYDKNQIANCEKAIVSNRNAFRGFVKWFQNQNAMIQKQQFSEKINSGGVYRQHKETKMLHWGFKEQNTISLWSKTAKNKDWSTGKWLIRLLFCLCFFSIFDHSVFIISSERLTFCKARLVNARTKAGNFRSGFDLKSVLISFSAQDFKRVKTDKRTNEPSCWDISKYWSVVEIFRFNFIHAIIRNSNLSRGVRS